MYLYSNTSSENKNTKDLLMTCRFFVQMETMLKNCVSSKQHLLYATDSNFFRSFPAFPLKNSTQKIPYSVQLNSCSSQNLLVLPQKILTSFLKSNSHLTIYSLFYCHYTRNKNESAIFIHGDFQLCWLNDCPNSFWRYLDISTWYETGFSQSFSCLDSSVCSNTFILCTYLPSTF